MTDPVPQTSFADALKELIRTFVERDTPVEEIAIALEDAAVAASEAEIDDDGEAA